MSDVKIFWDPQGLELDSIGRKKLDGISDGDTPSVTMSIRMLSIDTPEVHYPGGAKPSKQDENFKQLADWLEQGRAPISADLAAHLQPRLATGRAGSLQEEQGFKAKEVFGDLLRDHLSRPGHRKRSLFIRAADEHFDQYGRLLAYIAPAYSQKELATMTRKQRATFNLLLVEAGWAATLPIYPSLPRYQDLVLLQEAAKEAVQERRGAWARADSLTGYEFRMCVRLYELTKKLVQGKKVDSRDRKGWISRYCADMTTREIFLPQDYCRVPVYNRIFVWPQHVAEAAGRMNLAAAA